MIAASVFAREDVAPALASLAVVAAAVWLLFACWQTSNETVARRPK